ncbi:MAG: hypothetical protein LBR32_01890, partial [Propionibacteriaceae bacterium]|nr:hypothetical protein [Propionibacteriaceae bacterium]
MDAIRSLLWDGAVGVRGRVFAGAPRRSVIGRVVRRGMLLLTAFATAVLVAAPPALADEPDPSGTPGVV